MYIERGHWDPNRCFFHPLKSLQVFSVLSCAASKLTSTDVFQDVVNGAHK